MLNLDDRYQLLRRIGRGGAGEVYEGVQVALDRKVAIKLLRPELTARPEVVVRFEQEARLTCRLHHPNVVTVFDVGQAHSGERFLVMEMLEGRTLADAIELLGSFDVPAALEVAAQIARGMGAAQGLGLVHRDLKPENIFLLDDGQVKVLDFGLARLLEAGEAATGQLRRALKDKPESLDHLTKLKVPSLETLVPEEAAAPRKPKDLLAMMREEWDEEGAPSLPDDSVHSSDPVDQTWDGQSLFSVMSTEERSHPGASQARLTREGALVGTPRYMAPEQALCWAVDMRTDLYAFGCILYELLAGQAPFEAETIEEYLRLHVHGEPVPLRELAPEVPRPLEQLVHQCLAKDPAARPSDWAAVTSALRRVRGETQPTEALRASRTEVKPEAPYRFLQPFSAGSQGIFFGRDEDTQAFRSLWEGPDLVPLVTLTGTSGVGKTSFLYARVIPGLEATGHEVIQIRGGTRPTETLRTAVLRRLARVTDAPDAEPLAHLLDLLADQLARPLAVVFDQLEELFTGGGAAEEQAFQADLASVIGAGDQGVRFILSLREDYLGQLMRTLHPLPVDQLMRTMPLRSLGPEDIRDALAGPARAGDSVAYPAFRFETGLVDDIVADLLADDAGEVAPRIQAVGMRLWEMARDNAPPVITRNHYRRRLGSARGILARILDEAIEDLDAKDQGPAKELLRALTHLPGSPTSRPASARELVGTHADAERRLEVLARLESPWRIVQGFSDPRWPDERAYRISHEALITRIQQYGEENSDRNRARQLFQQGLSLWLQNGRRQQDLLPEEHFDVVLNHTSSLVFRSLDERDFFTACQQLHNDNWWRTEQKRRRGEQRRRILLVAAPVLLVIAGFLLGQAPTGFSSLYVLKARGLALMGVEGADLQGDTLNMAHLEYLKLVAPDLSDASLIHAHLEAAELPQARFVGANLEGAELNRAHLVGADLSDAALYQARFNGADLRAATVDTALQGDFHGALFDSATSWGGRPPPVGAIGPGGNADSQVFVDARFGHLDLKGINFEASNLKGTRFVSSSLMDGNLTMIQAQGADFTSADLANAQMDRADVRSASFAGARMVNADLRGADLREASLVGANLQGAKLSTANLKGAVADASTQWPMGFRPERAGVIVMVPGAELGGVDLQGRDLSSAQLGELDLRGAKLAGAILRSADLGGAQLDQLDLAGADLTAARLDGASLCGADLSTATLTAASFTGATSCSETRWPQGRAPAGVQED